METNPAFVETWDRLMIYGVYGFIILAVLILLYHEFRIFQIKDHKEKYDYVNLHEIRYFWYAVLALIVSAVLYANTIATQMIIDSGQMWFYSRIFITLCFGVVIYFTADSLVRIYYPRYVDKKLTRLRNKPRISPAGNIMRKLKEAEEESHLEASQFAEQKEVHSVDYDVWLDEATGYKKIEKYISYYHAMECSECGYVTSRIVREEITKSPTEYASGTLVKHLKCSYCGHREAREITIAALSENTVS